MSQAPINQSEFPKAPVRSVNQLGRKSVYMATVALGLISLLMIAYTYSSGNRLISTHCELSERALQMQIDMATAHLLVEELLAGDRSVEMASIRSNFELARSAVDSIVDFVARSNLSDIVAQNPDVRTELPLLIEDLDELWAALDSRLASPTELLAGSNADQAFDKVYGRFMERSANVESLIEDLTKRGKVWLRAALFLLSALLILGTIFAVLAQSKFYKNQTAGHTRMSLAYANLQGEMALREEATRALREGEELLSTALESTVDGLLVINATGKVVTANTKFAELWRIPEELLASRDDEKLIQYVLDQLVDPDQFLSKVKELYGTRRKDNDTLNFKDGRVFERYSAPMILDEEITGRVWSFRDVTEKRKAEEELRQSNQRLQLHVRQTPLACIEWDTELRIIDWNRAAEKIFGFTREEALGKQADQIMVGDEEWPQVVKAWRGLLERTDSTHVTNKNITKDSRKIVCEWYNTPLIDENGRVIGIASLVQDVTERHQNQEEIRKFKAIADEAPFGVGISDLEGVILYTNNALAVMHGYRPDELTGQSLTMLHSEEHLPFVMKNLQELMGRGSIASIEVPHLHKDGHTFPTLMNGVVVADDSGKQKFVAATTTDITDLKQLQTFAERAKRLETAGRIAGQVAHDFNNLLGPLTAYPELIRGELSEGHAAMELVDSMEAAANQIAEINQQLLTLGRRGHYSMKPLNLNDTVERVTKQAQPFPASIAVHLDLVSDLMCVSGGNSQISRALVNLLNNAVDAMQGEGTLTIKTENWYAVGLAGKYRQIPIGEYAKLTISDTGCGIPEESLLRIFEPFYTTKAADKKRGSGLGLSVVHAVMNDHGGCIDIESEAGKGTKVYLYFPITRESAELPVPENIVGGCERILVVDDDRMQRDVHKRLLGKLGYIVEVATSGEEAIEFLKSNEVDLLILDMIMPGGVDGTDTFVRAREINPEQKAVIVSGYAEGNRVQEAKSQGVGAFVKKPVNIATLARAVREAIDRVITPSHQIV